MNIFGQGKQIWLNQTLSKIDDNESIWEIKSGKPLALALSFKRIIFSFRNIMYYLNLNKKKTLSEHFRYTVLPMVYLCCFVYATPPSQKTLHPPPPCKPMYFPLRKVGVHNFTVWSNHQ